MCEYLNEIFIGTQIETEVQGKRQLKLLDRNETYIMNSPNLVIRFFPMPGVDWLGNVTIKCQETGLEAELNYRGNSFLPRPSVHRSIKGKIVMSSSSKTIYVVDGHWDRYANIQILSYYAFLNILLFFPIVCGMFCEPKSVLENSFIYLFIFFMKIIYYIKFDFFNREVTHSTVITVEQVGGIDQNAC